MLTASCDKRKTYADLLRDEIRIIDRFISKNNIVVLETFPADTVFASNEFFRDQATGVYFNIIDKGETGPASIPEDIYVRYDGLRLLTLDDKDTTTYSTLQAATANTLTYRGPVTLPTKQMYGDSTPAWAVPLRYIGHKGRAKMIVPFNMGSRTEISNNYTTYYDLVTYRFASKI